MTFRAEHWNISLLELWFCCVDNHWPYSKSAKAIQTALNRHQDQSHTTHNQQPTQTLSGFMQSRPRQSSSSRKTSGINPSRYGGTICIDFSRSSIRNAEKEKDLLTPVGRDFFIAKSRLTQMIWDWDFTKELGLGSCFVSSQFSIANNGSCTRMFKKRVEVIAFNQCWRDCQCAFHPPWERTSDNPPLTTTRPKSRPRTIG